MATNTLTNSQCRGFKPEAKAYKKFDGEGLYLLIKPIGSKLRRQAYRFQGKELRFLRWRVRLEPVLECCVDAGLPALAGGLESVHDLGRQSDRGRDMDQVVVTISDGRGFLLLHRWPFRMLRIPVIVTADSGAT